MGRWPTQESDWPSQNTFSVKINVYNRQKVLPISKDSVRKIVGALCEFLSIQCEEISIYFVGDRNICRLHKEFFNDPSPTDCITFPVDATYLGDLFICPAAAIRYDCHHPYKETLLYLVHGILHLLGYDDLEPIKRRTMRKMEKKCMDHLKKLDFRITA